VSCAEGDLVVALSNTGDDATTASVTYNGTTQSDIPVPVGGTSVSFDLAAGDENGTATASVTFAGEDATTVSAAVDCKHPNVSFSAHADCAEGALVVSLDNSGDDSLEATVTYNGITRTVTIPVGGRTETFDLNPADENHTATATVTPQGLAAVTLSAAIDCQHAEPGAGASVVCAEGGSVLVTLSNTGDDATTATVTYNGETKLDVPVPVGGTSVSFALNPADEGGNAVVSVTFEGLAPSAVSAAVDCQKPSVDGFSVECAEGNIVVTVSNDGDLPTDVTVNGETKSVPAGGTTEFNVPITGDGDTVITITGDELDTELTVPVDCLHPAPAASVKCAEGGVGVVLDNTVGEDTATFVVESPNLPDGSVTVTVEAGKSSQVIVPVDEDADVDVKVTSGDEVLFQDTVHRDCDTVKGEVLTPPAALPKTGSETRGLLELAGALLLAGAFFVAASRRRAEVL
jgi:LPXTG-motif cell wall-anchored protein